MIRTKMPQNVALLEKFTNQRYYIGLILTNPNTNTNTNPNPNRNPNPNKMLKYKIISLTESNKSVAYTKSTTAQPLQVNLGHNICDCLHRVNG